MRFWRPTSSGSTHETGRRFENDAGTNPEELVAAAHAGCFTMALSGQLGNAQLVADQLETKATLTFKKTDAGWSVTNIHLELVGSVPGADAEAFTKLANVAKQDCPISRLLKTNITLDAKLKD